jgi:hypothetical protein
MIAIPSQIANDLKLKAGCSCVVVVVVVHLHLVHLISKVLNQMMVPLNKNTK